MKENNNWIKAFLTAAALIVLLRLTTGTADLEGAILYFVIWTCLNSRNKK